MPSDFNQSVSVQWCDRDEIEDSERYVEITEVYPEVDHQISIIQEDIIRRTTHDFCIDQ